MQNPFEKAVKHAAKARVAIMGVSGGGKTFTALRLARQLAGPEGKIAYVDTEHGSAEKYADIFQFDHVCPDSFAPGTLQPLHDAAAANGYRVFVVDSLSHYWIGKDGAIEYVDERNKRHKDKFGGWKDFAPHERGMVDLFVRSPMHVIVTMRVKTDYQEQTDERTGKKTRVKIGLAPVQREGLEYEFDLVGSMDWDSTFIVDKTRCSALHGKAFTLPKESDFQPFVDWLAGVERTEGRPVVEQPTEEPLDVPKFRKALGKLCDRYLAAIGPNGVVRFERILRDNGIETLDHGKITLTRAEAIALHAKIDADCTKAEQWAREKAATPTAKAAQEFVDAVNPDDAPAEEAA